MTSFQTIYDMFLTKTTDDMYMEFTLQDTLNDLQTIFIASISRFEFPRFALYDFNLTTATYNIDLTYEEIDIISNLMIEEWLSRQTATIELIRQKYSGTDFKMTSQANHLAQLIKLSNDFRDRTHKLQRLYKRRKFNADGTISSNWSSVMERSALE